MSEFITLRRRTVILSVLFVLIIGMVLTNAVHLVDAKESISDDYQYLKAYTDVLALVQKNYVEPVKTKDLVEGSIKGMLLGLDPHSSYLNPENYKELQVETKGEFGGLGIEITVKDGLLTVVSPIEDSPAARAGVHPGDQIIKISDEYTRDLSLVDAVKKMRGPKGSPITISVHREGRKELIPLTIIRDIIKVKSVRHRMLDDGFGYVRLAQFQEGSADEFLLALEDLKKKNSGKPLRGLVMDLRNDPGGLLNQAVKVADIFLKDGIVVYTDGRLESQKQKYYAHDDRNEPEWPLIVLVNGGSASASEIVAGALQDSARALILGTQSFGKGSVQTILPMEGGSALRLTTALYFTRNGRSIQAQGVTPDVVVSSRRFPKDSEELLEEDEEGFPSKEKDLPGALRNPKLGNPKSVEETPKPEEQSQSTGDKTKPNVHSKKKQAPDDGSPSTLLGSRSIIDMDLPTLLKEDPQLEESLKLLKTWNVFQKKPTVAQVTQPKSDGASEPTT